MKTYIITDEQLSEIRRLFRERRLQAIMVTLDHLQELKEGQIKLKFRG